MRKIWTIHNDMLEFVDARIRSLSSQIIDKLRSVSGEVDFEIGYYRVARLT